MSLEAAAPPILEVRNLQKQFHAERGMLSQGPPTLVRAVDGVNFAIGAGKTLSLVGETGCGKTTTARMVLMVETQTAGEILFDGQDTRTFSRADLRRYRTSVQAVFQDPWSSLNPRMRVESIVAEAMEATGRTPKSEIKDRVAELLDAVGLSKSAARKFPHEFSGGQRQRIAIARALGPRPRLIVLDEPVSALDVSVRAQIMNLLKELQGEYGVSYLLIAHNLATVRFLADEVSVMYLGRLVETAPSSELFTAPLHPYTRALISASLSVRPGVEREEVVLHGEVPSPTNPPAGCTFHPRCPFAMPRCSIDVPELLSIRPGHRTACHLYPA
jgi:oligopeptide/dipeptide ABC transporter ATP-binding protein